MLVKSNKAEDRDDRKHCTHARFVIKYLQSLTVVTRSMEKAVIKKKKKRKKEGSKRGLLIILPKWKGKTHAATCKKPNKKYMSVVITVISALFVNC